MIVRRALGSILLSACFAAWALPGSAQTAPTSQPAAPAQQAGAGEQPYTIGVTVRRVVLDVVVTDSDHNAVHGLTRSDFEVLENNKQQPVQTFEEFNFDTAKPFTALKLPPMPPNTYLNLQTTDERGPLYVIVYDVVHMDPDDQTAARKQLQEFLAKKPDGTRFCLFLLKDDLRLVQGFTTNRNLLLQAFDTHRGEGNYIPLVSLMGANLGADDTDLPYTAMSLVGRYLEGLPGRKILVWLSSKFPEDVPLFGLNKQVAEAQMNVPGSNADGGPGLGAPPVDTGGMSTGASNETFAGTDAASQAQGMADADSTTLGDSYSQKLMRDALDSLNQSDVSVYPVDVAGAKPELNGMDNLADHIALVTGGKAYYNTNDFVTAMQQATEDGGSYYEITYAPTDAAYDARLRKIRVELDKRGYHLEYRRYYFADAPDAPILAKEKKAELEEADEHVAHKRGDLMFAYMEHGAPEAHEVIFRAQFHAGPKAQATKAQLDVLSQQPAYFVPGKASKIPKNLSVQTYTVDYLVPERMVATLNGQKDLEFAATAYDADGKMLNGLSQQAREDAGDAAKPGASPYFRAEQTLDVPVDAAWLRVAVRDVATNRIGTLEIPLPLAPDGGASQQQASR
ncbi:MAG TPA: VWA domain-containing protein [Acidobacteriaceae bacterium]|jgi:VWFA-related protein|nr:VWA domain-containing protein [Acidobacteriaceae bacterium]